ncbi:hypothetical protein JZ751_009800 [Albula glossodonta]|uniref:Fibrinogen C-terminal domain-containing protein n=1 Tax=Albula glossodonta TaxID=121402 RepID=A0A8T2NYN7_9TELE|nr:hypothetical protein JZ751_009800 [Albula glossodonta]
MGSTTEEEQEEEEEEEEIEEEEEEDINEEEISVTQESENKEEISSVSSNTTDSHRKSSQGSRHESPTKAHSRTTGRVTSKKFKRISQVVPGNARSLTFRNLRPHTRYSLTLFGKGSGLRSKIYRFFITTGKSMSMSVDSQHSSVTLSQLSPASSYEVSVMSVLGQEESDPIRGLVITVPDPPTGLQAVNVTDTKALLQWKASLATVDRYIIVYGSENAPDTTVKVPGNTVEQQLKGLRTGSLRFPFPTDCSQELLNGMQQSGEVEVFPSGKQGKPVRVYCDMETDGGGWTVFQRRMNGETDFFRGWSDYSYGFGNLSGEFWLGNEQIHNLTSLRPMALRVDLRAGADSAHAYYSFFYVDSHKRHYTLRVSGYSGNAGDSMRYHNGRPFSTRDKDSNPSITRCATSYRGGWWYKNCHEANLNGLYNTSSSHQFLPRSLSPSLPGPPSLPFLGNMLEFTRAHLPNHLTSLAHRYGNIYRLHCGNTSKVLLDYNETPVDLSEDFTVASSNVITTLVFGKEYDKSSPELQRLHGCLNEIVSLWGSSWISALDSYPLLRVGGARLCLGESIAKMELFLFTAYLLRDFQFLPSGNKESLPDLTGVAIKNKGNLEDLV